MTRAVLMSDEHERVLELAARYLRTLAAVERAHALHDHTDEAAILAGVDPVDVNIVGQELELLRSMYRIAPIRITGEPRAAPSPRAPRSRSADTVSASPAFFPESRRV